MKGEISGLIKKGESEKVELKPSLSQIKEIVEAVSAMSNTRGGVIAIGVSNSGKVIGVDTGKDTIGWISNKIVSNTEPKTYPRIRVEKVNGKRIIAIEVRDAENKPVLAFGRPFKRVGKSTVRVSKDEYERMVLEKHKEKIKFDEQICREASYGDIDSKKVRWYLEQRKNARKGSITNRVYREINSVSNKIAFEELSQLVEKKILRKIL